MRQISDCRSAGSWLAVLFGVFIFLAGTSSAAHLREWMSVDACSRDLQRLYLKLAEYSMKTYHVPEEEMIVATNGCAALVEMDDRNNLIVAFRGSVIPVYDRALQPAKELIRLMRLRSYQDWFQTNVRQSMGYLPAQYTEAAQLLVDQMLKHPYASRVFVTGHSKGGGLAEYAATAAWLSSYLPATLKERLYVATFNGAVVTAKNWAALESQVSPFLLEPFKRGNAPRIDAVIMRDDFVPKVDWRDRRLRPFVNLVIINPIRDIWATQQHSIAAVIEELKRRVDGGLFCPIGDAPPDGG